MNHLQLGIFIDKVLMISDESKIRFFRNEEYSLHEINGVISRSLGLTLVFEVFKKRNYKTFLEYIHSKMSKPGALKILNGLADYDILIKDVNKKKENIYKVNPEFLTYKFQK